MPELLHVGATIQCPHAASASISSTNSRVKVSGQAVALMPDTTTVSGCPLQDPTPRPIPCVTVKWLVPATRVRVMSTPVLLKTSSGLCMSAEQIPQGPPSVVVTQMRVKGI